MFTVYDPKFPHSVSTAFGLDGLSAFSTTFVMRLVAVWLHGPSSSAILTFCRGVVGMEWVGLLFMHFAQVELFSVFNQYKPKQFLKHHLFEIHNGIGPPACRAKVHVAGCR